jgi:hypothetical protein
MRLFVLLLLLLLPMVSAEIIGHRGSMYDGVGNTINAIQQGVHAEYIEIDIRVTADRELVVFHDNAIHEIRIRDMIITDVKKVVLPNGEFIPTLQEVFNTFPSTKFVLDIKDTGIKEIVEREITGRNVTLIGTYEVIKDYDGRKGMVVPFKDVKNVMMFLFSPQSIIDRARRVNARVMVLPSQFMKKSFLQKIPEDMQVWSYGKSTKKQADAVITDRP